VSLNPLKVRSAAERAWTADARDRILLGKPQIAKDYMLHYLVVRIRIDLREQVPYPELERTKREPAAAHVIHFSTFDEVRTRAIGAPRRLGMCRPFSGTTQVVFGPNRRPTVLGVST
jgi:hypothetical protein